MELDWQSNLKKIKDRGQYLLQTEKWSDCRFLVGTHPNQRLICSHKLILAMASPVFERMFFGNLPDKTDPIVIPDVQPDAFIALLEYVYSDRINITTFDKACELCYVAKKYMLPHVVERCTHFLWSDLSPKNACRAYEFAKLFDEPRLMQSSMELIAANTREVISDPSFLDIEVSTLMAILDQNRLNIDSELDLFNCLLKFTNERGILNNNDKDNVNSGNSNDVVEIKMEPDVAAMMHNRVDDDDHNDNFTSQSASTEAGAAATSTSHGHSSVSNVNVADEVVIVDSDASASGNASDVIDDFGDLDNPANIINIMDAQRTFMDEAMLRQAVKKIRFLTMTPQQFAEGPARSKLLQQHEALAILIKISSPTINDCPMPEGFCQSRSSRNINDSHRQRDLSSSANLETNPIIALINHASGMASILPPGPAASVQNTPVTMVHNRSQTVSLINFGNEPDGDTTTVSLNDLQRSYCLRSITRQFDYRNSSVTDCALTFQVDTNIWILGVQVPTQVLCGELMNSAGFAERYTEILYAHIQDMQGSRITYTHCTARVRYDSLLDITFDRAVHIYRNQIYKIYVVFNKIGWYTMYSCAPNVVCNRVKFMFNVGNCTESVRDGLIPAIIFSILPDHSRNMIE